MEIVGGTDVKYTAEEIQSITVNTLIDRGVRFGLKIPVDEEEENYEDLH